MKKGLILLLVAGTAHAAPTFPAESAWVPLHCGGAPMTDPFADDPNYLTDRDVVGNSNAPAGLRAADSQNLYLRMRLDQDPAPAGAVHPYSWGMEFDLDGDRSTYELLILVDGIGGAAGAVSVFTNRTTTMPNSGNDPADTPARATYTFANAARTLSDPATNNGGNADFVLDIAVPWSALQPLGLDHGTHTYVWVASSSSQNSLNGDFACEDAGTGPAQLDGTASDPTTGDPANDTGGPNGSLHLAGGGGCAAGGAPGAGALLALLALRRRTSGRVRDMRSQRGRSGQRRE